MSKAQLYQAGSKFPAWICQFRRQSIRPLLSRAALSNRHCYHRSASPAPAVRFRRIAAMTAFPRLSIAAMFASLLAALPAPVLAGAAPLSPQAFAARLAQCAAPAYRGTGFEIEPGSGGFALQMASGRHWLELAGRASFSLVDAEDGALLATVRVDQPAPGEFARQQGWREHALLDAAARTGAQLRQLDLPGGERLSTLNKREMTGKYAGITVLSAPESGLFVQWQWMPVPARGGTRGLDAVQAAVWRQVLPCAGLVAGAG
jgi:hypothetical protein